MSDPSTPATDASAEAPRREPTASTRAGTADDALEESGAARDEAAQRASTESETVELAPTAANTDAPPTGEPPSRETTHDAEILSTAAPVAADGEENRDDREGVASAVLEGGLEIRTDDSERQEVVVEASVPEPHDVTPAAEVSTEMPMEIYGGVLDAAAAHEVSQAADAAQKNPDQSTGTEEADALGHEEFLKPENSETKENIQEFTIEENIISLSAKQEWPDLSIWRKKKYMGGYRNKQDGSLYFNAFSQTPTAQEIKDAVWQDAPGCYISSHYDYAIRARPYFSSEDYEKLLNEKATVIQCFVRKCYAIRLVRRLRQERDARLRAMAAKEKRRKALEDKRRKKEIESRLHPKTARDFEILYNGLEHWRLQETLAINNAGYSEPARLAALADLMDQEATLIQKIDRLKITASEENRERKIVKLLEKMASPKRWPVLNNTAAVHVDTPNTIRARELRDLYHALTATLLSVDERLQILLHVKYTVKEFDCVLTREIVELINREGDLVSRGRGAESLEGLRKRIGALFLQFVQTPEFNPEAALYQKAGQSWKRDQAVYYCRGCTKYLPSTEFYLSTTIKHLGRCKPCTLAANRANARKDDSGYADLLRAMRMQEAARRTETGAPADAHYNAVALLQEADMRHLVDVVWGRQSCVSAARSMDELVLVRWDSHVELSPWNCILLTKAEADKHEQQSDPTQLYTEDFVRKIKQKHLAARRHFAQLPAMERYLKRHYCEDAEGRLIPITESMPVSTSLEAAS
ncbi:hypothetical protein HDU83_005131 [Entophlyctis luteolus]|nr:hypothetical protein HDU83_005131 [Entophlyctis luteolus]